MMWAIGGAVAAIVLIVVVIWLRRRSRRRSMISIVMFLKEPRALDATLLSAKVEAAWGVKFDRENPEPEEFVVGDPPAFVVKTREGMFLVNTFPVPYVDDPAKEAAEIKELRLHKAFAEHRAWLSVDLIGQDAPIGIPGAYKRIGKLIAELMDEDCLMFYCPQTGRMNVPTEEVVAGLKGDDPLGAVTAFDQPPVTGISGDDPRMVAAVEEARRRWPEFVEAFRTGREEQMFSVKAPFTDGENTEFMWVHVTAIEGETIRGKLGNEPVGVKGIKLDDEVTVALKDLNDWMYLVDEKPQGGFTIKVLQQAAGE
jgi:uncharacterized protein YegJ (DUF2314 family)